VTPSVNEEVKDSEANRVADDAPNNDNGEGLNGPRKEGEPGVAEEKAVADGGKSDGEEAGEEACDKQKGEVEDGSDSKTDVGEDEEDDAAADAVIEEIRGKADEENGAVVSEPTAEKSEEHCEDEEKSTENPTQDMSGACSIENRDRSPLKDDVELPLTDFAVSDSMTTSTGQLVGAASLEASEQEVPVSAGDVGEADGKPEVDRESDRDSVTVVGNEDGEPDDDDVRKEESDAEMNVDAPAEPSRENAAPTGAGKDGEPDDEDVRKEESGAEMNGDAPAEASRESTAPTGAGKVQMARSKAEARKRKHENGCTISLVVANQDGTAETKSFPLELGGAPVRIGRYSNNHVVLPSLSVSNQHCDLKLVPNADSSNGRAWQLVIRDLSSNGTGVTSLGADVLRIEKGADTPLEDESIVVVPIKFKRGGARPLDSKRTCFSVHLGDRPIPSRPPQMPRFDDEGDEIVPAATAPKSSSRPQPEVSKELAQVPPTNGVRSASAELERKKAKKVKKAKKKCEKEVEQERSASPVKPKGAKVDVARGRNHSGGRSRGRSRGKKHHSRTSPKKSKRRASGDSSSESRRRRAARRALESPQRGGKKGKATGTDLKRRASRSRSGGSPQGDSRRRFLDKRRKISRSSSAGVRRKGGKISKHHRAAPAGRDKDRSRSRRRSRPRRRDSLSKGRPQRRARSSS